MTEECDEAASEKQGAGRNLGDQPLTTQTPRPRRAFAAPAGYHSTPSAHPADLLGRYPLSWKWKRVRALAMGLALFYKPRPIEGATGRDRAIERLHRVSIAAASVSGWPVRSQNHVRADEPGGRRKHAHEVTVHTRLSRMRCSTRNSSPDPIDELRDRSIACAGLGSLRCGRGPSLAHCGWPVCPLP